MQLEQLLTPSEAARLKGMKLNKFSYHIRKPTAPKPVLIGKHGHAFYDQDEIRLWQPTKRGKK